MFPPRHVLFAGFLFTQSCRVVRRVDQVSSTVSPSLGRFPIALPTPYAYPGSAVSGNASGRFVISLRTHALCVRVVDHNTVFEIAEHPVSQKIRLNHGYVRGVHCSRLSWKSVWQTTHLCRLRFAGITPIIGRVLCGRHSSAFRRAKSLPAVTFYSKKIDRNSFKNVSDHLEEKNMPTRYAVTYVTFFSPT